jgi:hypothetical protein
VRWLEAAADLGIRGQFEHQVSAFGALVLGGCRPFVNPGRAVGDVVEEELVLWSVCFPFFHSVSHARCWYPFLP